MHLHSFQYLQIFLYIAISLPFIFQLFDSPVSTIHYEVHHYLRHCRPSHGPLCCGLEASCEYLNTEIHFESSVLIISKNVDRADSGATPTEQPAPSGAAPSGSPSGGFDGFPGGGYPAGFPSGTGFPSGSPSGSPSGFPSGAPEHHHGHHGHGGFGGPRPTGPPGGVPSGFPEGPIPTGGFPGGPGAESSFTILPYGEPTPSAGAGEVHAVRDFPFGFPEASGIPSGVPSGFPQGPIPTGGFPGGESGEGSFTGLPSALPTPSAGGESQSGFRRLHARQVRPVMV